MCQTANSVQFSRRSRKLHRIRRHLRNLTRSRPNSVQFLLLGHPQDGPRLRRRAHRALHDRPPGPRQRLARHTRFFHRRRGLRSHLGRRPARPPARRQRGARLRPPRRAPQGRAPQRPARQGRAPRRGRRGRRQRLRPHGRRGVQRLQNQRGPGLRLPRAADGRGPAHRPRPGPGPAPLLPRRRQRRGQGLRRQQLPHGPHAARILVPHDRGARRLNRHRLHVYFFPLSQRKRAAAGAAPIAVQSRSSIAAYTKASFCAISAFHGNSR